MAIGSNRVEIQLDHFFDSAPLGLCLTDVDLRFVRVNESLAAINGMSVPEHIGRTLREINPTIAATVEPVLRRVIDSGDPVLEFEFRAKTPSNPDEERYWLMRSYPLKSSEGAVVGVSAIVQDNTERKRADEAIRESAKRYRAAFDGAAEGVLIADTKTKEFKYANSAICAMLGYTEEELKQRGVVDIHPKEDLKHVISEFEAQARGEERLAVNIPCLRKDGTIFYADINTSMVLIDGTECNVGFLSDVTKRKQAEEALRESEERYRSLTDDVLDGLAVGIFILDADFRVVWVNQALERYFGLRRDKVVGKDKRKLIAERIMRIFEAPEAFAERVLATYEDNTYIENFECHVLADYEREERWLEHWSQPIRFGLYAGGRIEHYYDITPRKTAEEALRDSESRYRALFEQAPDSIVVIDPKRRGPLEFNDRAHQNLGYTREEFQNLVISDIEIIESAEEVAQHIDKIVKEGAGTFETKQRTKSGEIRDVLVVCKMISSRGKPVFQSIWSDITERKRMEEKLRESSATLAKMLEEQNTLLQHTRDFVFRHDTRGVFNYLSPAVEQVTGYRVEEWWKHYTTYLTDNPINDKVITYTEETLRTGKESPPYLVEITHKDGHPVMLEVNERPYFEAGKVAGIIGVARDVSERVRAEAELKKAKEEAEAASRAKSAFLANMSHEVRTPAMAILGAAERLGQATQLGQLDYSDTILRNGRHLVSLIDDLLDIARMEAGKLTVEPSDCSLPDIMADIQAVTALQAKRNVDYRIIYEGRIPKTIHTDAKRLRQAVINLVSNALKFTEAGHVHLRVKVDHAGGEPRLSVTVEDTGVGIPSGALERIFEPFSQLDTSDVGLTAGVGLGLPLTKWIADQLGGGIDVESVVGRGSTFTLRVCTGSLDGVEWVTPTEVVGAPEPAVRPDRASRLRLHGRILLAEDSRDVRELIHEALTEAGAEVTAVADGQQAVEAATREPYDLILMDLHMPEMDGLRAAAELRRRGCQSVMIAVTAWTEPSERARVFDAGFDDIWPKPLSVEHVVEQSGTYVETTSADIASKPAQRSDPPGVKKHDTRLAAARAEFVPSLELRACRLREAVEAGDLDQARDILHQLVGSAGILGFMTVSHEAARLLAMAKAGSLADFPAELRTLEALVSTIIELPEVNCRRRDSNPHPVARTGF